MHLPRTKVDRFYIYIIIYCSVSQVLNMPIVLKRQNGKIIFQYKVGLVAAPGDPIKVLEQGAPWRQRKPGGRTTSTVTGGRASTAAAAVDDDGEECAN